MPKIDVRRVRQVLRRSIRTSTKQDSRAQSARTSLAPGTAPTRLTSLQVVAGTIGGVLGFLLGGCIGFIVLFILWIPIGLVSLLFGASDRAIINAIGPIFLLLAGGICVVPGARIFCEMFAPKK